MTPSALRAGHLALLLSAAGAALASLQAQIRPEMGELARTVSVTTEGTRRADQRTQELPGRGFEAGRAEFISRP